MYMKKIITLFVFSLLAANNAHSNSFFLETPKEKSFAKSQKNNPVFLANEEPRNIDVLNYDLELDWVEILPSTKDEPEKRWWNGKIKITLTPLENNLSVVELDAVKLKINSVKIDDYLLAEVPSNDDGKLKIPLETPINTSDTVSITIEYVYDNPENRGFSHRNSPIESGVPAETVRPSAGTLSQTNNSRYWFPCNDRPSDKAIFTAKVTVPLGITAVSNGILDSTVENYDWLSMKWTETFFWRSIEPMPPYLFTVAASEYTLHKEKIKINSTTDDSLDVYYYVWGEDWEGDNFNAKNALSQTEKTMIIFGDLFGDYPFSHYGVAVVDYSHLGFWSVGMEHQTLTTVSRRWFNTIFSVPEFSGFAHEIAHHWFGNLVTCHTWKDVWIQEGAASWLESIYAERIGDTVDKEKYYNQQLNHRRTYLKHIEQNPIIFETPIYGLDDETGIFQFSSLAYTKASWVYHQLREFFNGWFNDEELFFSYMRELLDSHRFGTITTEQFIDFWDLKFKTPYNFMELFLSQWIYSAGHPKYEINSHSEIIDNGMYNIISVTLKQVQNVPNVPSIFLMPLEILFYKNDEIVHTKNVWNISNHETFDFVLDFDIDSVSLNHKKALFEIVENKHTNINEYSKNAKRIFPNPLINTNEFFVELEDETLRSIEFIDVLGQSIKEGFEIKQINNSLATVKINSLENGFYFIKLNGKYYEKLMIFNGK